MRMAKPKRKPESAQARKAASETARALAMRRWANTPDRGKVTIAAKLGISTQTLRKYESDAVPWPDGMRERYDAIQAERAAKS